MKRWHKGVLGASLGLVGAMGVFALGPVPAVDGHPFDRQRNALWLGHRWFQSSPPTAELAQRLRRAGIRYVYVHVGPLDAKGQIPEWKPDRWQPTLAALRQQVPGMQVYAWIGGVTTDMYGVAPDTVDLASSQVRDAVAATARRVDTDGHFDGVHYDLEQIPSDSSGFVSLLDTTRQGLSNTLSVAVPLIKPPLIPTHYPWTRDYFYQVAGHCDQICMMAYDSLMPTQTLYRRLMAWEVKQASDVRCQLVMGVPTYRDRTFAHNPAVERLGPALDGIAWGLQQSGSPAAFEGIALYAEWTTTPGDWDDLTARW